MRRISLPAVIALCVSLGATDKVQPLKIRTGLWEVTTVTAPSEEMAIPAALLEKLTPEQRSRIKERIDAQKSETGKTTITKQCLTLKQLDQGLPFQPNGKSCKWIVLTSSSTQVEMRGECVDQAIKTEKTLRIEAQGAEEVAGSVRCLANGGKTTHSFISTFQAKWIGPQCRIHY